MTQKHDASVPHPSLGEEGSLLPRPTRRTVLTAGSAVLGGAGACTLAVPFLDSLRRTQASSAASTQEEAVMDVSVQDLDPGAHKIVVWQGLPVAIQHRTPEMIRALEDPALLAQLADPQSHTTQQPREAENPHRSLRAEYGVYVTICTHLGCVPNYRNIQSLPASGGFFCPCHGSQFDGAGRVLRNMPAPYNLPVPPLHFVDDHTIRLGESTISPHYSMNSIQQL
ncbi:ubiquinol-cytochrome c reductase iron-sulfur subunit [Bombella mellum]|uniref:Ubiquinol-cytochrome c reductase iron-sulfur subunit n=1 Tax=Bombella mellum TaxID=2039288 RepID=A0ABR5ZUN1_9PROT|nr:ubiquinol-cytochrome c reductase iron-sulfur subunit [Bombella mellum]MBA5728041.1 ubiquinol-cytochrome c reductase iron-sulfur subunit [Bombella mellum]